MAVFRVEKNRGYTVMSNHHLRNRDLTLKAKGLLSQMLSLPEDWDYTLAGLAKINREQVDAIRTAVWELEKAGYIQRRQGRDDKGKMTAIEYIIFEQPQPLLDFPTSAASPVLDFPTPDKPTLENPSSENPMQLNTNLQSTEELNTDVSSNDSYPIPSPSLSQTQDGNGMDRDVTAMSAYEVYREIILENIEYGILSLRSTDNARLTEIVELMVETICTARKTIRIAGDDYPAELVKAKFLHLNSSHIEYVMNCMAENTSDIRNIKKYMLAVLFNASTTIDSYYAAKVNHDLYGGD